jgi:hypothetical protein
MSHTKSDFGSTFLVSETPTSVGPGRELRVISVMGSSDQPKECLRYKLTGSRMKYISGIFLLD